MAKVIEAELKLKYKEAVKNLDEMQKEYSKLEKQIDDTNKTAKKSEKGLTGLSKGFKSIGTAFKAAGIGLVVSLFAALAAALAKNQKVMDAVAVVTGTISQVFTAVGNVLVTVYENVTQATENFDALGRVVGNVFKIALAPFKLLIDGLALTFYSAQLAWEQSFFGSGDTEKIAALNEKIGETKQSLEDTVEGVKEAGSAIVKDFGEAVDEVSNIGKQVVDGLSDISVKAIAENVKANEQLKKAAAEARIVNQGLIEQYDRQAEQQRQIRDNDLKSIDDRIAANDNLKATLEEQEKSMLANADLMIQQAELQFKLSGLEEDRLALLEARNEKKAIEAQIEGFMSEQESNRVALLKEKMELELSNDEATALRQSEERNFNAEMEESEVRRIQMMLDNLEIERGVEEERLRIKRDSYEEGTQAFIDANNELLDFQQESANTQEKLEQDLDKGKKSRMKKMMGDIVSIVGANSKFGKAVAIAGAIQDTYAGASKALKQGGIFGFVGAAAVIAAGLKNVKQIAGTKSPKPPSGLGARDTGDSPTSVPSASTAVSLPPQFDTVGASGVNQLADALGNQAPVQAFVVSGDVTTAQELDRNIIQGASIG
tara:strand:- start:264 stop:2069 length:1806 start_codon:yes stop_codon:yes gene_type:complete